MPYIFIKSMKLGYYTIITILYVFLWFLINKFVKLIYNYFLNYWEDYKYICFMYFTNQLTHLNSNNLIQYISLLNTV